MVYRDVNSQAIILRPPPMEEPSTGITRTGITPCILNTGTVCADTKSLLTVRTIMVSSTLRSVSYCVTPSALASGPAASRDGNVWCGTTLTSCCVRVSLVASVRSFAYWRGVLVTCSSDFSTQVCACDAYGNDVLDATRGWEANVVDGSACGEFTKARGCDAYAFTVVGGCEKVGLE